jgi:hypothetical protein
MKNIAKDIENNDKTNEYCYLSAQEFMDDGSNIDLKIRIDKQTVFFIVI